MTLVQDANVESEVRQLVQEALDRRQPQTYRIEVQPEGVLQDDDWFHVVVGTANDVRSYDFYNVLADVEGELQDEKNLKVLLVPAIVE